MALDPGSRNAGIALIKINEEEKVSLILEQTVYLKENLLQDRLVTIKKTLENLILEYKPSHISFEIPYVMGKNAAGLLYVCGILMYLAGKYQLPIYSYTATEVKKAVTGKGKAEKDLVESSVLKFLEGKDTVSFSSDHSSDAAAIALTHYLKTNEN